nr:hypothetical protein [Bradyrhizobium sp. SZCCHNR1020]
MQRDHVLAFLDSGELSVDLVPLGLEPVHDRRQRRRIDAVFDDGIARPVKLALDLAAALFQLATGVAGIAGEALAFLVVRLDVFDQIGRPAQLGAEAVERKSLDVVALDAAPVGARPAFFVCRALQPGGALALADRGESAAACCATQKAGQYAPFLVRAACPPADRAGLPPDALAGLGGLPKIVADDPQMRGISDAPLVRRVGARYALAARRVLNHADFVPGDAADIDFV